MCIRDRHQLIAFAALSQDYAVCFLPVVVHPVPGIAQQHTPLEFHRIQPVVDHGYLGAGVGGHGVYCAAVGSYYAPLSLRGGGHIVHVRELPAAAVFPAHGPYAVRVYGLDVYKRQAVAWFHIGDIVHLGIRDVQQL